MRRMKQQYGARCLGAAEEVASHQAKDLEARVVHGDEIAYESVDADRRRRLEEELVVVCAFEMN